MCRIIMIVRGELMFDIKTNFDDIEISCLDIKDILLTKKLLDEQKINYDNLISGLSIGDFFDRYMESLISESEMFLKICKNKKIIGLLKGRVEFKNPNEVWFQYLFIIQEYRENGIGSKILDKSIEYLTKNNMFNIFFALVEDNNDRAINFLKNNSFTFYRGVQNYFQSNNIHADMNIYRKINKNVNKK